MVFFHKLFTDYILSECLQEIKKLFIFYIVMFILIHNNNMAHGGLVQNYNENQYSFTSMDNT